MMYLSLQDYDHPQIDSALPALRTIVIVQLWRLLCHAVHLLLLAKVYSLDLALLNDGGTRCQY